MGLPWDPAPPRCLPLLHRAGRCHLQVCGHPFPNFLIFLRPLPAHPESATDQALSVEDGLKNDGKEKEKAVTVPKEQEDQKGAEAKNSLNDKGSGEGGVRVCGVWLPTLGQIFVWRVLANPLFLMLTFSVVTARTAMRAFGMLVPAFGESLGMGKEESTYLLTIMSVADFLSR